HAAVGDERHLAPTILQDSKRRQQLVQFGHAVRLGTLKAHDRHEITIENSRFEFLLQLFLRMKDACRCLDDVAVLRYRRGLDDCMAEVAFEDGKPPARIEGMSAAAQNLFIAALLRCIRPAEGSVAGKLGLDQIAVETSSPNGLDIAVKKPASEKLANQKSHAARR